MIDASGGFYRGSAGVSGHDSGGESGGSVDGVDRGCIAGAGRGSGGGAVAVSVTPQKLAQVCLNSGHGQGGALAAT